MNLKQRIKELEKRGKDDQQTIVVHWADEPGPELKPGDTQIIIKWDEADGVTSTRRVIQ